MNKMSADDWRAKNRSDRSRFAREMSLELATMAGRVQALATLISHYMVEDPDLPPFALPARPAERLHPRATESSPVTSPRAQNEGLDIQGGDRKAQKEVAIPVASSARTASAEPTEADLRNSSRSPAAEPPAAAGERTTVSIAPKGEQVLALWATTSFSATVIAARVGCSASSISAFISIARKKGDPRADARGKPDPEPEAAPPPPPPPAPPAADRPVLIPRKDEDAEPPISGFSKPPAALPFISDQIASLKGIGRRDDAQFTQMGVVAIDPESFIIRGPLNDWTTDKPTCRTLQRMNRDALFDKGTLLEAGPWPGQASFDNRIPLLKRHLAAIGVEFLDLKGAGCKMRLAEVS